MWVSERPDTIVLPFAPQMSFNDLIHYLLVDGQGYVCVVEMDIQFGRLIGNEPERAAFHVSQHPFHLIRPRSRQLRSELAKQGLSPHVPPWPLQLTAP